MQNVNISDFKGLFLSPNSFSLVPPGAMEIASNVVIRSDGIISKRHGFSLLTAAASLTNPVGILEYSSSLFILHNSVIASLNTTSGALTPLSGTVTLDSSYSPRSAQLNGNLYLTGQSKIYKVESASLPVLSSGIPPGLDVSISLSTNAGILTPNKTTGYRVVFGRQDANSNKITGAPSELTTITNSYRSTTATYSSSSFTVTVTSTSHGLATNDQVVIAGATDANCNGTWTVTVTGANTFTYTSITAPTTTTGSLSWGIYRKPTLEITVPVGLTTEHFYQIYRASEVTSGSSVVEDLQNIYEANLSSGEVTAGKITFVDSIAELFKGGYLYTNPSQSGITSANFEPPIAKDLCAFKECLFLADIEGKAFKTFNLVSAVATDLAGGDYVTVTQSAVTKRYVATTTAPTPGATGTISSTNWDYGTVDSNGYSYFLVTSPGGSVSVATSIESTCKSLCKAINRHSTASVYAYYTSSATEAPGAFKLVSKVSGTAFTISGSQAAAASKPFLPDLDSVSVNSEEDEEQASVAFSKLQQPESFPLGNRLRVGAQSSPIRRIIPLQDAVIVLKRDDGVWKITGDSPSNFTVSQVDATLKCVASDSVVTLNNQVYMLSNQGVVAISEQGAQVISRQIENVIQPILGSAYVDIETSAVAYESERSLYLSTINPSSTVADVVYVYNLTTNAWTTSTETFYYGNVYFSDDKLYLIAQDESLLKERKSFDKTDYCDRSYACTIHSVPSTTTAQLNITSAPSISVGDCFIKTGSTSINRITSIDANTSPYPTVTFASPHGLAVSDTGTYYSSIESVVKLAPVTMGDVNVWKQFSEFKVSLRNSSCSKLTFSFFNDNGIASDSVEWLSQNTSGAGWNYNWGSDWDGASTSSIASTQSSEAIRTYIPMQQSRGTFLQAQLVHLSAAEEMLIQSVGITGRVFGSTKTTR